MKIIALVIMGIVLVGCGQINDFTKGKKIEHKMSQYIDSGLSSSKKGFYLELPYDPIAQNIDNLPDSKYKTTLKQSWDDVVIKQNYKMAKTDLDKAISIRTGR